ncbi:MAG: GAF domain-containing protein [Aggregatilineales bacterium]
MADTRADPIDSVHDIRRLVTELETALRKQQELLQLRDMSLPDAVFQALAAVRDSLARAEAQLVEDLTTLSQLRALAGTTDQINSSLDLDTVLAEAMDQVIALTGAERGYIALANPFAEDVEFRIARDPEKPPGSPVAFEGSRTILREVLDTGRPLLADNAYKDPRFLQSSATIAHLVLRSVLCVPIKHKDRVIGAVYVDNRLREAVFTQREADLLTAFANQVAVAIENARLYARVQTSIAAITEMKELMSSVFESIGSGVITTNAAHAVTTFNRAAAEILAWDPAGVVGAPLPALMPRLNVDLAAHLEAVLNSGQPCALEAEQDNPARGCLALSLRLSPLRGAVDERGVAVVLDDLTRQRQNEEMLNIVRRYLPPEMVDNIQSIARLDLGGERREITCMFVNVRPLASFPPGLRPQELMDLLNLHLTTATTCIHDCKGVIDKYMGHEIMALFNSQLNPQTHHAMLAVEAALALRDAFAALYQRLGIAPDPHYYRVGLHTGVATLGNVGSLSRRDFTALGDTVNLAKRLEENAAAGQIIASQAVRQHIEAYAGGALPPTVVFQQRAVLQVKGRQQRTPIYEVSRA